LDKIGVKDLKLTNETIAEVNLRDPYPEFARTQQVEKLFGLKRGTVYNLFTDGKIKGVLIRVRGQKSGVRLWDTNSIREFIRSSAIPSDCMHTIISRDIIK
jgi:hypothetical protein